MKPLIISTANDVNFVTQGVTMLKQTIMESIAARGLAMIGLSGGSTPKPIYDALGKEKIDWSKVWIFLVDDRYIRADDPNSNRFLLRSTLLKNAAIPESQIIFPDTSLPLPECMALYEKHLKSLFQMVRQTHQGQGSPDLITLGMGDDGHIASLFPPLTDEAFGPSLVIHTTTDKFVVRDRVSVTLPVLTQARQSVFFLKGAEKKRVWEEMIASSETQKRWPAKAVMEKTSVSVIAQW